MRGREREARCVWAKEGCPWCRGGRREMRNGGGAVLFSDEAEDATDDVAGSELFGIRLDEPSAHGFNQS